MKSYMIRLLAIAIFLALNSFLAFGQSGTTALLSGQVFDPGGAVISGATVIVKNNANGTEYKATTSSNGTYSVPSLGAATYTVAVEAQGFKKAVVEGVKLDAGVPATANITMEVGVASETVVVQGGAEVLQTQSANVATTITGRQINELPFTSRDALDLVLLLPGTTTPGRPRTSTINGLPKGAINITTDGVNVQDNTLRSSDGFFTYIRPRIDAVEEVTLSTATPGAESAGEGAVQIKFSTKQGGNEYHGTLYEYHRNPYLNANYWYNNRDNSFNVQAGKPCGNPSAPSFNPATMVAWSTDCEAPRDRVLLNQYGGAVGGPISIPKLFNGRDRAFFFVNYEEYRLPEQVTRNRTILGPLAQQGIFQYNTSSGVRQVNLLDLAATVGCSGCTTTIDPTIQNLLGDIRNSTTTAGSILGLTDPNLQQFTFTNTGGQDRYFPTVRLDFNLTEKHHLENVWNYNKFGGKADFLNNRDPQFPGFPNIGSQLSNRFSNVTALRSTFTSRLVNEARFGFTGGTVLFFADATAADFNGPVANQQGFALNLNAASGNIGLGLTNAHNTTAPSRRNAPVWQFSDTLTWTRSSHNLSFGFNFTQINFWSQDQTLVPTINFGIDSSDPASAMFSGTNATTFFPDISAADLTRAQLLYAVLTGHVTSINSNARLSEDNGQYNFLGTLTQRARQREIGFFAQDSWRARQNLTVTGGLRLEVQFPFTALNDVYAQTTFAELFGVSGQGNLFAPGSQNGPLTGAQYTQFTSGTLSYDTDYTNFAPSVGFAWTPNYKGGFLGRLFGEGGQTVLRGGYSLAYNREGVNTFTSILGGNPGGTLTTNRNLNLQNLGTLPVLLRETGRLGPPSFPNTPNFPNTGQITDSVNAFNPNLQMGYVQSWSFGLQREIDRDTVIEARYVGTRGVKLWQQYNLNEINISENRFLDEFRLAQSNMAICQANSAACLSAQAQLNIPTAARTANNYAFLGLPGQSPLPIILRHFNPTGNPNSPAAHVVLNAQGNPVSLGNFAAAAFVNTLAVNGPAPVTFANTLLTTGSFRNNALAAGQAPNFFVVNPDKLGGAFSIENNGRTYYDAAVVELRRRLSRGLLVQGSYTFARATTNMPVSSAVVFYQPRSLRNINGDKTLSPFGITHGFKANWIYELPIGTGKAFAGNVGKTLDRIVGGWEFHGTTRIQSGSPVNFGNVQLVGMTRNDLQKAIKIRQSVTVDINGNPVIPTGSATPASVTYYLPQDIIANTRRAFNVSATSASGYSALGAPTGRYIAPASSGGCIESFTAQCGTNHLVVYGPMFTRFDLSVLKRFKITEGTNFEFRAEFLNAFNNINFLIGNPANDVTNIGGLNDAGFGQTVNAYRDTSTTNDPGGRLIQFVARFNF